MANQAAYQQFLKSPKTSLLAPTASLHYITTLTSFNGPAAILKHLSAQDYDLKKNEEKFLNVVESASALATETHTDIEFVHGGSAYLPGLDDNFLSDRIVTLPIIHFVTFDASGAILQIRQSWDQGSLLRQLDVIGKSGRNWPIRDGKDQIKLITMSTKCDGTAADVGETIEEKINRSRGNSSNAMRDPYASLSLFEPREKPDPQPRSRSPGIATRNSARPRERDLHELTAMDDSEASVPLSGKSRGRSGSPLKDTSAPLHSRNYAPSRLFDNDENAPLSPEQVRARGVSQKPKGKHSSQWGFEDFNTPQKAVPTKVLNTRVADVRHWGTSDDEVAPTPVKAKIVAKPRHTNESHFEIKDDDTPQANRQIGRPRGAGTNKGMGLYQNNLYDDEQGGQAGGPEKVATILANVKDRKKDFEPHFAFDDTSPAVKVSQEPLREDRAKAIKMMDANWSSYDESPTKAEHPESRNPLAENTNAKTNRNAGIHTGGDGMGGKKGTGRSWGFGDDSDGEEAGGLNVAGGKFRKGMPGKAQSQKATGGDFWDF